MGVARLLAKGWVVFCLFAGAHELRFALMGGSPPLEALQNVGLPVLLFVAMGLLFVGGYGVSSAQRTPLIARFKARHLIPGFNELVFIAFMIVSFIAQTVLAPSLMVGPVPDALERAIAFVVPGQAALVDALSPCLLDGGRILASAFTWLLAIIYLASAVSRLKLQAGIIRIERTLRPEALGPLVLAFVLGTAAIAGIQLFYMGSIYPLLDCPAYTDVAGALLIGLAPLMLAYLIVAGLATAMATGPE
jgi:hypothetical protein